MTAQEREKLIELCENFKKLTEADRIRITGIAEGMVIARELTEIPTTKEVTKNEAKA